MHLLNVKTRKLETFVESEVPEYAILSHTWGKDEATFDDLKSTTKRWRLRISSTKINGCCAQAAADGLDYVWIDTCCIDKSSSAELSEAINSMFRWYAGAKACYVYLSDVRPIPRKRDRNRGSHSANPGPGNPVSEFRRRAEWVDPAQLEDLRNSRWFRRGWTLQELLAPTLLKVFDCTWQLIGYSIHGDRNSECEKWTAPSISQSLATIADIPRWSLQNSLEAYSVAEKMSWAAGRQTTRTEDMAYCLLGIFGVNMPMLYGEGAGAFVRLQEEILKKYDDQTIFTWGLNNTPYQPIKDENRMLALSPADYSGCGSVRAWRRDRETGTFSHYVLTNGGIHIELPMIKLMSGEYLAQLECTLQSDIEREGWLSPGEPSKYLCLLLVQSQDRSNVFYRRTSASPIAVSPQYFARGLRRTVYLSPPPPGTYSLANYGPLWLSKACAKFFQVRHTYPAGAIYGTQEGDHLLMKDIMKVLEEGKSIFLDCVGINGLQFAIHVRFGSQNRQQTFREGVSTIDDPFGTATITICRQRDSISMVELMMEPKDFDARKQGSAGNSAVRQAWEKDCIVESCQMVLHKNMQPDRYTWEDWTNWTIDAFEKKSR